MLTKKTRESRNLHKERATAGFDVVCSWCGAVIRSSADADEKQMCLICHARMLNDYFQRLRKVSDERRALRRF